MKRTSLLIASSIFASSLVATVLVAQPPVATSQVVKGAPGAPPKEPAKPAAPVDPDVKALEAAGMKTGDVPALLKYLKDRTLSNDALKNIQGLIAKFSSEQKFDVRIGAQEDLLKIGGPAEAPLKLAAKDDSDAEIKYRAQDTLRRLSKEKSVSSDLTSVVIRALGKAKSPDIMPALFAYLPLADTPVIVEQIQAAVTANSAEDGKPLPMLVDALKDESPLRRRVAAVALASGGTEKQRVRFKDLQPTLVEMAKSDKDNAVRFELSRILLIESRNKAAVAMLIDTLPDSTRGQSWVVEELLVQLAAGSKDAPKDRTKHTGGNKSGREKVRDAWKKWWEANQDKIDIDKLAIKQTIRGEFVMCQTTYVNRQQFVLKEYSTDDKEKNSIAFDLNNGIMDVTFVDDRMLSIDGSSATIIERDSSTGKEIKAHQIPQDKAAKNFGFQSKTLTKLDNGNYYVVHANGAVELDKDFKEVSRYNRPTVNNQPQYDLVSACKMKDGRTVLQLNTGKIVTLDEKMKEDKERKAINAQAPGYRANIIPTGDDKVLVVEQQQIAEYDLKTGKAEGFKVQNVWNVAGLVRLPNGNIMYVDQNTWPNRIVEKTASGEEVFSKQMDNQNGQLLKGFVK